MGENGHQPRDCCTSVGVFNEGMLTDTANSIKIAEEADRTANIFTGSMLPFL